MSVNKKYVINTEEPDEALPKYPILKSEKEMKEKYKEENKMPILSLPKILLAKAK